MLSFSTWIPAAPGEVCSTLALFYVSFLCPESLAMRAGLPGGRGRVLANCAGLARACPTGQGLRGPRDPRFPGRAEGITALQPFPALGPDLQSRAGFTRCNSAPFARPARASWGCPGGGPAEGQPLCCHTGWYGLAFLVLAILLSSGPVSAKAKAGPSWQARARLTRQQAHEHLQVPATPPGLHAGTEHSQPRATAILHAGRGLQSREGEGQGEEGDEG